MSDYDWYPHEEYDEEFGVNYLEIEFEEKIHETQKAILFRIQNEEVWIPKSVINDLTLTKERFKKSGTVEVAEWFAEKEGFNCL